MSTLHVVALVVAWSGVAVVVLCSAGVAIVSDLFDRMHFVSAMTAVGAPLLVVSQALQAEGWRSALKLLVIAGLLVATGPITTSVTARARSRATGWRPRP